MLVGEDFKYENLLKGLGSVPVIFNRGEVEGGRPVGGVTSMMINS